MHKSATSAVVCGAMVAMLLPSGLAVYSQQGLPPIPGGQPSPPRVEHPLVPAPSEDTGVWLTELKSIETDAEDSELVKLLKQRHNAALDEYRARSGLYRGGRGSLDLVFEALLRLTKAGMEIAQTQAERLKYRQISFDLAKDREKIIRDQFEDRVAPIRVLRRATRQRITTEIDLLRLEAAALTDLGHPQPASTTREVKKLQQERYEACIEETEECQALYRGGRTSLDEVLEAIQERTNAGVETARTSYEQFQHLEAGLAAAKQVEKLVREKFEEGWEPIQAMHQATYCRLDLEIKLLRAKHSTSALVPGLTAKSQTNSTDAKLQELLKERYRTVSNELVARQQLYAGGRASLDDILETIQLRTDAGIETARTSDERFHHLEASLAAAMQVEKILRGKFEAGVVPSEAMHQATYARLDAQIALLRAGSNAKRGPVER